MIRSVWVLSFKFLIEKRGRSFFSILGISLGILMITTVQIIFSTLDHSYTVLQHQQYGDYDVLAYYQSNGHSLNYQEIHLVKSIQGVAAAQPILYPYQGHLPFVLSYPFLVASLSTAIWASKQNILTSLSQY